MIKYVAGFLFDEDGDRVALILKNRGTYSVTGKWNAIGGKRNMMATGQIENSTVAMQREFIEETGVDVQDWQPFLLLRPKRNNPEWQVDFFHAFNTKKLSQVKTMESELVMIWNLNKLPDVVSNLKWIIPMAFIHHNQHAYIYDVIEKDIYLNL